LIDLPPLIKDAALKQPSYFAIIRNADLALIVVTDLTQVKQILKDFSDSHILLNKPRPAIRIKKTSTDGLEFIGEKLIKCKMDDVKKVLRDNNVSNAIIEVFEPVSLDDFFEVMNEKLAYLPALIVLNKQDSGGKLIVHKNFTIIPISVLQKINLDLLQEKSWEKLRLIKVYTKEPGKKPSLKEPITLPKGSSIKDMAMHVHKDFIKKFKYARVWGSAKHDGAAVGPDYCLGDNDIVEIHLK